MREVRVLFAPAYMAAVKEEVLTVDKPYVHARYVDHIYVDIESEDGARPKQTFTGSPQTLENVSREPISGTGIPTSTASTNSKYISVYLMAHDYKVLMRDSHRIRNDAVTVTDVMS